MREILILSTWATRRPLAGMAAFMIIYNFVSSRLFSRFVVSRQAVFVQQLRKDRQRRGPSIFFQCRSWNDLSTSFRTVSTIFTITDLLDKSDLVNCDASDPHCMRIAGGFCQMSDLSRHGVPHSRRARRHFTLPIWLLHSLSNYLSE